MGSKSAAAVWLLIAAYASNAPAASTPTAVIQKQGRLVRFSSAPLTPFIGNPISPGHLSKLNEFNARDVCRSLDQVVPSEFSQGLVGWECTSYVELTSGTEASSIFLQVKGETDSSFSSFRIKINIPNETDQSRVLNAATGFIDRFPFILPKPSKSYLLERVRQLTPFESWLENHNATFGPELIHRHRYNLLVRPDREQAPPCEGLPVNALTRTLMVAPVSCARLSAS